MFFERLGKEAFVKKCEVGMRVKKINKRSSGGKTGSIIRVYKAQAYVEGTRIGDGLRDAVDVKYDDGKIGIACNPCNLVKINNQEA